MTVEHAYENDLSQPSKDLASSKRPHPQQSCASTRIATNSFFGKLRELYANVVLKTQLEQLKKQGSYDGFKLQWHPAYAIRQIKGAQMRQDGLPPSMFWESDVGKWIEAACYFLSTMGPECPNREEYESSVQELVDMIEAAQQDDGYLNIYFTVVDPVGKLRNLRDMHEMYNTGHLLEAALAHYNYTGSRQFLNVMIKNIECLSEAVGPNDGQIHGYPGHPELELAVLRLYALTRDPLHLEFGRYLVRERGVRRAEYRHEPFFVYEARERNDELTGHHMDSVHDLEYSQSHRPLDQQETIVGHSVRAFYLLTAAADLGESFLASANRLFKDAVDYKMYVTGGLGSEPRFEGFHRARHRLPQSTDEGGCYAETCASIACMMTAERLLSWQLDQKARDTLELCLLNSVLGGGSLDGKQFSYVNKLATSGSETAARDDWYEVCCCPPNVSRTLGMLGGYTWRAEILEDTKTIALDIYLFASAARVIPLPDGEIASVNQSTQMPWFGNSTLTLNAPEGWQWCINLPNPGYADNYEILGRSHATKTPGFAEITSEAVSTINIKFDMPVHMLSSHYATGQDTLSVRRGPISYVAETFDNDKLEKEHPHFYGVGLKPNTKFFEREMDIGGFPVIALVVEANDVWKEVSTASQPAYRRVEHAHPTRQWIKAGCDLVLIPWFARANRGGKVHVRTGFLRVN